MAKEGRVGLGLWDRLVLFTAWAVTCGLVYVLGFYVGKGTQEQRIGMEERVVRLPVTSKPPAEGQRPQSDSGLTFYDTLGGERGDAGAPPVRAPEPAPAPRATPPSTAPPARAASVPTTLPPPPARPAPPPGAAATPPAAARPATLPSEPAPRPAVAPVAAASPPVVRPVVAPAAAHPAVATVPGTITSTPLPAAAPAAAPPMGARPVPPPSMSPPAPPADVAAVRPPSPPPGRAWTVQANPTRNHDEADALYRQLRGRGYDAVVVRVLRDGETWYRVQVGRFASAGQAGETMQRLREREGVQHVFVASE